MASTVLTRLPPNDLELSRSAARASPDPLSRTLAGEASLRIASLKTLL
ncbi:MAG: hypothetical protein AB1449_15215 [Chloroflexota bacterium]